MGALESFYGSRPLQIRSAHVILSSRSLNLLPKIHMLTLNSIIQRNPEVIAAEVDQELIMVSLATEHYYGVSDVARDIWDAVERPKKVSDLVDDLTATYDIDPSSCKDQTLSFLETLFNEGLLQVKDGSAS